MEAIFIDGIHDYDYSEEVVDDEVIHILFRSNGKHWTSSCRGEELISITNTGNGFVFNHSKPKKEMDYDYAFCLSIMLKKLSFNDHKVQITGPAVDL